MQYYEMVGYLTCKPLSIFTLVVCIFAALGSCLPQIVASSSNVYRINQNLNKRGRLWMHPSRQLLFVQLVYPCPRLLLLPAACRLPA